MGDIRPAAMSIQPPSLSRVYGDYVQHCSLPRNETELAVLEAIRAQHGDSHITTVDTEQCDIIQYAAAGHASATLIREEHNFFGLRTYSAPETRLVEGEGTLSEKVQFGKFVVNFRNAEYVVFTTHWQNMFSSRQRRSFILASKDQVGEDGHAPAVDAMILTIGKWTSELHKEIYVFDDGEWDKNSLLWEAVQSSNWEDVIIEPKMKNALIRDVNSFFDSRALFQKYAVPWKRGIILHGTPGCGKTISIKALMNSLDKRPTPVASLYVKTFQCCSGEQWSIRQIFTRAREMAPCLLVFEDLDSLVKDKVRSYFLNEVDGLESNDGILMIGSTNHLDRLDPSISKRPSRFDRKYHYRLPSEQERIAYCNYWKTKVDQNSDVDFNPEISTIVAKSTEGWSYAYLKELFVQTLLALAFGGDTEEDADEGDESTDEEMAKAAEEGLKATDADGNVHRVPRIEIPTHLQDNNVLRILRKQLIALWKDMDNSGGSDKATKEKADEDGKKEDEEEEEDTCRPRFNRRAVSDD